MSNFLVSDETMQRLSDADSALADLVMSLMFDEDSDPEVVNLIVKNGVGLYEFQHELVARGLAREVLDRSDRQAVDADA